MLLLFDEDLKLSLSILEKLGLEAAKTVVNSLVNNLLEQSANLEDTAAITEHVGLPDEEGQALRDGILFLLLESSKLMMTEIDFNDSLMTLGFNEELRSFLLSVYLEHRGDIRLISLRMSVSLPYYKDLEWRLQIKTASRSLGQQLDASVMMRLHTGPDASPQTTLLQCDLPNLVHLTEVLEEAQREAKSQYTRRILRNIK